MQNKKIEEALANGERCQRNYDLSKIIDTEDLYTMMYACIKAPSKQNEIHFKVKVYTEPNVIEKVYRQTKEFSLHRPGEESNIEEDKYLIFNPQVKANAVFCFFSDFDSEELRSATSSLANSVFVHERKFTTNWADDHLKIRVLNHKSMSVGIASGQLVLAAQLLGYRTGFCAAFNHDGIKRVLGTDDEPELLVGVGYPNKNKSRLESPDLKWKDLPKDYGYPGKEDEYFVFPTYSKNINCELDGEVVEFQ